MSRRLFVHASNIHQGGGGALLGGILRGLPSDIDLILTVDSRFAVPDGVESQVEIRRVEPSIASRFKAEKWLAANVKADDLVLCLGNLPPLFELPGYVVVFLQNRFLLEKAGLSEFPTMIRLRLAVERKWLAHRLSNANEFVVQTPSMKVLLEKLTGNDKRISVLPFIEDYSGYSRSTPVPDVSRKSNFDFLYVASGDPHKNHRRLVSAWCLLAQEGFFPSLRLTVNVKQYPELCAWIEQKMEHYQLKIVNQGDLQHQEVLDLYKQASALIYPSTMESFGLPLIEARQAGLAVLAAELDYVRDVLDPEQTFDSKSYVSIARAVKRFLDLDEPALSLKDAEGFIREIIARPESEPDT